MLHSLKEKSQASPSKCSSSHPASLWLLAANSHHTINLELQTFVAMVFISLPINQEWVLSFLAKSIPYLLTIKTRSKTIHMFFEIVTNDKTKKLQVLRYCIKQYIGKFHQKRSAEYACYIISSWLLQTNLSLCVICHP